jgi:hypothetical protein
MITSLGQHDRLDAIAHEITVPFIQLGHVGRRQNLQGEIQVRVQVQAACQVILIELIVACLVRVGIEDATRAQIIAPGMVAVATEQGVVEVE